MAFLRRGRLIVLAFWAAFAAPSVASADPVADFYRGRTLSILVGFGPGGGYDLTARTLARYFGRHIPGEPNVVVRNVPGAAGLVLANSLYNLSPRDGTEIGTFNRTIPLDPMLDGTKSQFDAQKFSWIGSTSNEVSTCVAWHTAPVKTIQDAMTTELVVAGTGPAADAVMYPRLMNDILGTKFKMVTGYQGAADSIMAMERGEAQSFCAWTWGSLTATHGDWLRNRTVNVLVQFGLRKHADHPEIPLVLDLAKTTKDRQALELMMSPLLFARPFAAPPGIPQERLTALRKAFDATVRDPDFLADAGKQGLEIDLVTGAEIETVLARLYVTPADVVDRVKAALK
ncbi:MAG: tripartite tricarboxylate transporter family receptor [Hyphomicrobiales bacterium]|nr:tripartite tricarboxylate transporter family receptor [Hyphomicrobiales bacterium]